VPTSLYKNTFFGLVAQYHEKANVRPHLQTTILFGRSILYKILKE